MSASPSVAILLPRRPDGGRRDELWKFCRARWERFFPDWEIHESDSDGPGFNRGQAINRAKDRALESFRPDVLLVIDGDVAIDPGQVWDAVVSAHETGRACFPFTRYLGLDERMTSEVLGGFEGDWSRCRALKMGKHESSVMAVPVALWHETGGFDERLTSWGMDDLIFSHVCRVLGGGVDRIPGPVFHLHHPHTPDRAKNHPGIRANNALGRRYFAAERPTAVDRLIAQRAAPVATVVVSNGRRECIHRTLAAHTTNLADGGGGPLVISDDTRDPDFLAYLRLHWPWAEIVHPPKGQKGFAANTLRAQEAALETGAPWVFHLEEDFVLQQRVSLMDMVRVMEANPHLAQIVLKRQAWFPREIEAGGIVEMDPTAYTERSMEIGDRTVKWVEHSLGFWTNPHLVGRDFLAAHPWPARVRDSERIFGQQVIAEGYRSAYWGGLDDPPLVEHIGERSGTGY